VEGLAEGVVVGLVLGVVVAPGFGLIPGLLIPGLLIPGLLLGLVDGVVPVPVPVPSVPVPVPVPVPPVPVPDGAQELISSATLATEVNNKPIFFITPLVDCS
jgi:hypothetical protein